MKLLEKGSTVYYASVCGHQLSLEKGCVILINAKLLGKAILVKLHQDDDDDDDLHNVAVELSRGLVVLPSVLSALCAKM